MTPEGPSSQPLMDKSIFGHSAIAFTSSSISDVALVQYCCAQKWSGDSCLRSSL